MALTRGRKVLAAVEIGVLFHGPAFARALWEPEPGTRPWDDVRSLLHLAHTKIPYETVWVLDGSTAGDDVRGLRLLPPAGAAAVPAGPGIITRPTVTDSRWPHDTDAYDE